jgi:hypothetical protein
MPVTIRGAPRYAVSSSLPLRHPWDRSSLRLRCSVHILDMRREKVLHRMAVASDCLCRMILRDRSVCNHVRLSGALGATCSERQSRCSVVTIYTHRLSTQSLGITPTRCICGRVWAPDRRRVRPTTSWTEMQRCRDEGPFDAFACVASAKLRS